MLSEKYGDESKILTTPRLRNLKKNKNDSYFYGSTVTSAVIRRSNKLKEIIGGKFGES